MSKKILYADVAYNTMREMQEKLHSEYVMSSTFEECLNQDYLKTFKDNFITQSTEEKHHYIRILFLTAFNTKKIPFTNNDVFSLKTKESIIFHIPLTFYPNDPNFFASKIITLKQKCALTNELLDILTYSIIPSFYFMFLENSTFKIFRSLIKKLQDENEKQLSYQLSRSLFVSPMFLKYLRQVMQSLLQPAYSNNPSSISITNLKELIKQSFIKNTNIIPSYIKTFFKKVGDTFNFLKESLFNPMLQNPEIFLIVDFFYKNDKRMVNFKAILKKIIDDEFIQEISQIIDKTENFEKSIFIPKSDEIEQTQSEINVRIIDTIDIQALIYMNKVLKSKNKVKNNNSTIFESFFNMKYQLFRSIFSEEEDDLNIVGDLNDNNNYSNEDKPFIKPTTIDSKDKWMLLRRILKNAQPLPEITLEHKAVDTNVFKEIIEKQIVSRYDSFKYVDAKILLEILDDEIARDFKDLYISNLYYFNKKMKDLDIKHDEQTIVMQMISKFKNELQFLSDKRMEAIELMEKRFLAHLLDLYDFDKDFQEIIPQKKCDFLNSKECLKNFNNYLKVQMKKASKLFDNNCQEILSGRFYRNFDFYSFLSLRPDLQKFDNIANDMLHKSLLRNFQEKIIIKIYKKIKDMSVFNDLFLQFNKAFEMNCCPVTKYLAINKSISNIRMSFIKYTGEDDLDSILQFVVFFISYIRPLYYVSNIIFLLDYFDFMNTKFSNSEKIFEKLTYTLMYANEDSFVFNKHPIPRLAQSMHRRCELFITGNDPNVVAESLRKIIFLLKEKDKMNDQDVASLAEEINNNKKGKIFKFHKSILRFNNKTLQWFTHFDIRVGIDIPLNKVGDEDYLMRMALFFFSSRKSSFGNKELRNFVNSKNIQNSDKKIICVNQDKKLNPQANIEILGLDNYCATVANIIYETFTS